MPRHDSRTRLRWLTALSWSAFAAGLLIQLFAPRLEISNGAFVIPAALTAQEQNSIRPDVMVAAERRKQLLSAVLTVSGALALAYRYRHAFAPRRDYPDDKIQTPQGS